MGLLGRLCLWASEESLFRVAFSLVFFGVLTLGELVSPSTFGSGGLRYENFGFFEDRVKFCLRRSKTDQRGRGCRVKLFVVPGSVMCLVAIFLSFRNIQG